MSVYVTNKSFYFTSKSVYVTSKSVYVMLLVEVFFRVAPLING